MAVHVSLSIATSDSHHAQDVTDLVATSVADVSGAVLVSVPHTTCALFLSEVDDELLRDMARVGRSLLDGFEPFTHARNGVPNAAAHIASSLFGTAIVLGVDTGVLQLGRYQRIVLLELDGPKERTLTVRVLA